MLETEEELKSVRFANNYEFYWKEGNFLPITIIRYFKNTLTEALRECQFFCTWGHIEWGSPEGLEEEILTYDKQAHRFISEHKFLAVCAYDASSLSEVLQKQLLDRHSYLIKDNQLTRLT